MTKIKWPQEVMPFLLFLLMPLGCFPELFFKERTLYFADLTWIHYPLRVLAAEQWLSGTVPLWNPYVWLGFPLLAESQVGVLYPLNLFFLLPIPPYFALTLFTTAHFTMAAMFTYILVRSLGISRIGATIGGLSFGFGGFLMTQVPNLNVMTGGVWMPLIFGCFIHALRQRRWEVAVLGGAALALQVLTTQPQIVFYTVLLLISYALYQTGQIIFGRAVNSSSADIARVWGLLALTCGLGLLLAAPQLLPMWELKNLSVRSDGLTYDAFIFHSLALHQWLGLILPSVFGNSVLSPTQALSTNFTEAYLYIGILPLVMILFSGQKRHRPEVVFLWLLIPLAVLLSLGHYTPLYLILQKVPIFDLFRIPSRWSLIVTFAMSLLAAWGVDAFLEQPASRRVRGGLLGLWVGLTVSFVLMSFFSEPLLQWANTLPAKSDLVHALQMLFKDSLFKVAWPYQDRLILQPLNWWVMPKAALVTRLGATVILLIAYSAHYLSRRNFGMAIIILTAVEMSLSGGTAINNVTAASFWQQPSAAAHYIIEAQQNNPTMTRIFSVKDNRRAETVMARLGEYLPSFYHLFAVTGHHSPLLLEQYSQYDALLTQNPSLSLLLTGDRFVIASAPILADADKIFPLVYYDDNWYVYENPHPLPRTFVVHQAMAVANNDEALLHLREIDPRQTVILETDTPLPILTPSGESKSQAVIKNYRPSAVEIEANLDSNGFLVLLDTYYPGWEALVDGQPTPIKRANYFARAIYLEAGSHTINFVYRPWSFRVGAALSIMGLFIVAAAMGSIWRTRHRIF